MTNESTFNEAKRWIQDYCVENEVVKVLVGNKLDRKETNETHRKRCENLQIKFVSNGLKLVLKKTLMLKK